MSFPTHVLHVLSFSILATTSASSTSQVLALTLKTPNGHNIDHYPALGASRPFPVIAPTATKFLNRCIPVFNAVASRFAEGGSDLPDAFSTWVLLKLPKEIANASKEMLLLRPGRNFLFLPFTSAHMPLDAPEPVPGVNRRVFDKCAQLICQLRILRHRTSRTILIPP